jgi:hypothetical protein
MEESQECGSKDPGFQMRANVLLRLQIQKTHENLNKLSSQLKSLQDENEKLSSFTQKVEIPEYPLPEDTFLDSIEKSLQNIQLSRKSQLLESFQSLITMLLIVLIGIMLSRLIQRSKSLIPVF